ncbi:MAG TPA: phage tail protein [Burkholderiaceae bacterium]|nr:phage tail protein [Burkholderiaceae bacterium]HQR70480.1 phage tail protein [Burkholderiaceae bacterium]
MKASSASSKRTPKAAAARSAPPVQPYTSLHFAVGIHGLQGSGAVEVVLPTAQIVELPRRVRSVQFGPLALRRGLTDSTEWFDWWRTARRLPLVKRLVTVVLLKPDGAEAVRWLFPDCVPVGYAVTPLSAILGSTVIETLELKVGDFQLFRRE